MDQKLIFSSSLKSSGINYPSSFFENLADLDRVFETLITKKQLAERLALSQSFINQLMNEEGLPFFRIGRSVRFRVREVVAWLQQRRQP